MRLSRFYTERQNITINSSVKLNDSDNTHIRKVLRLQPGDEILLFNGEKEYLAELKVVSREVITAKVKGVQRQEDFSKESLVELVLFQSLPKAGKIELIIEKTVELGVDAIVPMQTEYSQNDRQKAEMKQDRWNRVALAAAKQCERITVPEVYSPIDFFDIKDLVDEFDLLIMFTLLGDAPQKVNLNKLISSTKFSKNKVGFLIGPEGGFSPAEEVLATELGIHKLQVFPNVLRTETAAIALAAVVKYELSFHI